MSPQPSRDTTAGAAYLDLQAAARATGRPVDELFQLYALEGFLRRLVETDHAATFVLKGGVLLAAYTERRPTRDIDLAGTDVDGDLTAIASIVADILTVNLDDGLDQLAIAKVEEIRDDASYPGIRATVTGQLDRARLRFHVDINIGDPLWPEPDLVELPQLLDAEPIPVRAYSAELILAEKIVTAIQRGTASTRWRDFVDIAALAKAARHDPPQHIPTDGRGPSTSEHPPVGRRPRRLRQPGTKQMVGLAQSPSPPHHTRAIR